MSPHIKASKNPRSSLTGVAFLLSCAACTPLSTPANSSQKSGEDAGSDASQDANAAGDDDRDAAMISTRAKRCDAEGALRCAAASRQRERCQDERWVVAEPCGDGEVCATTQSTPGQCVAVIDVCRGNVDATVCDSEGTMFKCGGNGVVASSERCASPRHCQIGVAAHSCASCLPGQFRCSGDTLDVCGADGKQYTKAEACAPGTCDAEAGLCRGAPCLEERAICTGDVLKVCARGANEFSEVARCGPGLCNAAAARCDVCVERRLTFAP